MGLMNTVSLAQCLTRGSKVFQGNHFYHLRLVLVYVLTLRIAQQKLAHSHGSLLPSWKELLSHFGPQSPPTILSSWAQSSHIKTGIPPLVWSLTSSRYVCAGVCDVHMFVSVYICV